MYYKCVLQTWIQFRKDPHTERADEKHLAPVEVRVSLWCVKNTVAAKRKNVIFFLFHI